MGTGKFMLRTTLALNRAVRAGFYGLATIATAVIFISDSAGETVKYLPINELLRPPAAAAGTTQGGAAK